MTKFTLFICYLLCVIWVGFASFCFIIGFLLLTAGAIYISPLICGSNNERKMIRAPEEIDATYSAYSEKTSSPSAPNQV